MEYATDYMVNMGRKILEQNNYLFTINIDKLINEIDIINLKFLSVLWLANKCNLKAYKLSRIYKNDSGKSLKNYIFQVKMNKAIELLNIKNNLTINEVSKIMGYKNSQHFSKIFKEYYNKTPFEVKKSSKINSRIMQKFRGSQYRDVDLLKNKKHELVKHFIDNLELKILGSLNIKMIADKYSINYRYLSRNFTKVYGISLCMYIIKTKMQKCEALLLSNCDITIKNIAKISGYSRVDYFRKIFKKYIGKTPLKCKKK